MHPFAPRPIADALATIHRRPSVFSFGIPRLDLRVGDVGPGDLVVVMTTGLVATAPFLAFVALEAARRGVRTLYVEDVISERTAALYWLAAATGCHAAELRDDALPARQPAVMSSISDLAAIPLHYAESAGRSMEDIATMIAEMPLVPGLVVAELASSVDLGADHAIGSSLRALRRLAVAQDCVVLASLAVWAHPNGGVEGLPTFGSDPTACLIPTVILQLDLSDHGDERRVLVHLTRTRGGETGFVPLTYTRGCGRFEDWHNVTI